MQIRLKIWALAVVSTLAFGCQKERNTDVGGLLRGDAQFVMTPDRCSLSMLPDNFRLEHVGKARSGDRSMTIAGGAGRSISLDVRGTLDGATEAVAKLEIRIGSEKKQYDIPRSADGGFIISQQGKLADGSGGTEIAVSASIDGELPAGETALLQIDSFDAAIGGAKPCG